MPLALKAFAALGIEDQFDSDMLGALFDKFSEDRARVSHLLATTFERSSTAGAIASLSPAGVPVSEVPDFDDALERPLFKGFDAAPLVTAECVSTGLPRRKDPTGQPLRVLEIAGYISGPFVGRLMADFGAHVTKVEPPDGDPLRRQGLSFAAWNHGKRCVRLDLATPQARSLLHDFIREADVVVTNYLPHVAAALGLDHATVFSLNPRAILASIGGYPEWSGLAQSAAFDPAIQAKFGLMRLQGGSDEPVKPQIASSDYIAAMLATGGILAALHHRRDEGSSCGYRVRTSLAAAGYLLAAGARDLPGGCLRGGRDFRGRETVPSIHRTLDGWVAVCAGPGDRILLPRISSLVSASTTEDAIAEMAIHGYQALPCLHPEELADNTAYRAAGLFHQIQDEAVGEVITPRIFSLGSG